MTRGVEGIRLLAGHARAVASPLEPEEVAGRLAAAATALRPDAACAVERCPPGEYRGLARAVAQARRPLALADALADPRAAGDPLVTPERPAYYGVPLAVGDAVLGVLGMACPRGKPPTPSERAMLELLAGQAVVALRNARLVARSEARRRAAEALAEVGRLLSRTLDPDAVTRQIAESLCRLLGSRAAAIYRVEPGSGDLVTLATVDADGRPIPGGRVARGTGLVGVAVRERRPVSTPNLLHDPRVTLPSEERARLEQVTDRAALAVPLIVQHHVTGVLSVADREGRSFDEEEMALAEAFADQAALALENARLFALESARCAQVEALADMEREVAAELRSDRLLRLAVDRISRLLDADGIIYLTGPGPCLAAGAWSGAAALPEVSLAPGQDVGGLAAQDLRGVVVNDYPSWPGHLPARAALGVTRVMAEPMIVRDRLLGVIAASRTSDGAPPFLADDLAVLERFARHAAIALQNATLYEETERRRREAEEMARLARALTESLDRAAVAGRIADSVLTLSGARASGLRLLQPDGSLVAVARGGEAETYLPAGHVTPPGMGISGRAVAEARPVATADVFSDPRIRISEDMRRRLAGSTLGAYLAVPLRLKERVLGALWIGDRPGRTFTEREIDLLQMFADQAALALENARLYERLEERARKLTALSQLTRLVTSAEDSAQVFPAVARYAARVLGARMARVWVDEPAAGGLRARGSFGIDPEIEGIMTDYPVIAYGHGVVGRIFESRTPEFLPDIGSDPRWLNRRLATEAALRAFAGLPLIVGDRTVGVLSIIFGEQRDFDAEDRELMAVIADQAAIAINRARLYEGLEARAARLRTLAHLNRIVSSSLDPREVLDGIARAAAELMATPLVSIWTADEGAGILERHAFSDAGLGADHPGRVRRFGEGGVGWVARHRKPLNVPDVFADERIISRDWFERHGLRSTLAVPILFQDVLLGVLVLFGRQPFVLDADGQDLLDSFVAQAAVALRNARVYEELREAKVRLERSQAQLVQAERLSALGEMAAGVAHDFNNLLAVILGRAELLHRRLGDTELGGWVEAIRQAAQDGADTVRRIQEFTRTRTTRLFEPVDVGRVLREVVELTRPRWQDEAQSRGVRYEVCVAGEATPTVAARPEELREVFTNLLVNALDAMPQGGRCVLRAAVDGDVVEVAVSDTGCGMTEDVRQRVFEPFFTTKGPRGNGLGLAVVWGIVKRHGGTIAVTSAPGAGSTFTVRLPATVAGPPGPAPAPAPVAAGPARILVVDDDPGVRRVLADLLTEAGYGVVEAVGGPEALECCGAEAFDLVLSDLSMPDMSGWDLAAACLEQFPDLPVGLITGWGDRLDAAQLARHRVRFVIAKPFESRDVLAEIARVLEGQRGS